MHSAPGLVCSDRPEGRLLSHFDPSVTQTVPTVSVRRSGMAVQGWLAYPSPIQRVVGRSQGLGASAPQPVGASVSWEKSKLSPVQRISFLCVELDSVSIRHASRRNVPKQCWTAWVPSEAGMWYHWKFQRLLGHMASAAAVTPLGLLHMRPLQHWLHSRVPRWAWCRGWLWVGIT